MPKKNKGSGKKYSVLSQDCTTSDGKKGTHVLKIKPKSGKYKGRKRDSQGRVKIGCHTSDTKANAQRAAIEGGPRWIAEISKIVEQVLSEEDVKSTKKYDSNKNLKGDQDKLPDNLQKGIIKKANPKDPDLDEDDTPHLASYKAPQGSKRDKQLDATKADLKSGDPERKQRAYRRRDRMERQHREKNESVLRTVVRDIILEELSKATEDKIRKKAEERGYTFGSMKSEYKKGLAAFASSGSRPGMTAHGWAMARINKCTESQDWSGCKKSKAKKKK